MTHKSVKSSEQLCFKPRKLLLNYFSFACQNMIEDDQSLPKEAAMGLKS